MGWALKSHSQEFAIYANRFIVGRGHDVDLPLNDDSVSRRHAAFRIENDQPFVEDLRSRNGTLVNGRPIVGRVRLALGDRIAVGAQEFCLTRAPAKAFAADRITEPLQRVQWDASGGAADVIAKLSPREREVFALLARGCSQRDVANHFSVSIKTIETHRTRIGRKLGARTRAELIRCALEGGVLRASDLGH
jgi:DNA-binding CsgD family transcriptional regulator